MNPLLDNLSTCTPDDVSSAVFDLVLRVFAKRIPSKMQSTFSAEDLAQETAIKLASIFKTSASKCEWTDAYVLAVAQRTLIDRIRKHFAQKREPEGGFENVAPQSSMNLLAELTRSEKSPSQLSVLKELWPLVNQHLNQQEQMIVELRFIQELSNAEIAELLELTESSIRSQLFRIYEKLRGELSKRPDFESFL